MPSVTQLRSTGGRGLALLTPAWPPLRRPQGGGLCGPGLGAGSGNKPGPCSPSSSFSATSSLSAHGSALNPECWFTHLTAQHVQSGCQNLVIWNSKKVNEPQRADSRAFRERLVWTASAPGPSLHHCLGSASLSHALSWDSKVALRARLHLQKG